MRSLSRYIALFCLLLTLASAVGVVVHHHDGPNEAAKCTVCVASHALAPPLLPAFQE